MADFQAEQASATLASMKLDLESESALARVNAVRDAFRWLGELGTKDIPSEKVRRLIFPDEQAERDLRREARRVLLDLHTCETASARTQARSLSARLCAERARRRRLSRKEGFSVQDAEAILRGVDE